MSTESALGIGLSFLDDWASLLEITVSSITSAVAVGYEYRKSTRETGIIYESITGESCKVYYPVEIEIKELPARESSRGGSQPPAR